MTLYYQFYLFFYRVNNQLTTVDWTTSSLFWTFNLMAKVTSTWTSCRDVSRAFGIPRSLSTWCHSQGCWQNNKNEEQSHPHSAPWWRATNWCWLCTLGWITSIHQGCGQHWWLPCLHKATQCRCSVLLQSKIVLFHMIASCVLPPVPLFGHICRLSRVSAWL